MPKRLTDTGKWDRQWYMALEPRLKCFWDYLCDQCDHSGFWSENYELASQRIGAQISRDDLAPFGKRIIRIKEDKIWIRRFVEFQYSVGLGLREKKLNPENNAHRGVIRALEANGIDSTPWIRFIHTESEVIHNAPQPEESFDGLLSPTGIGTGKGIGIGKEEGGGGGEKQWAPCPAGVAWWRRLLPQRVMP